MPLTIVIPPKAPSDAEGNVTVVTELKDDAVAMPTQTACPPIAVDADETRDQVMSRVEDNEDGTLFPLTSAM